MDLATTLRVRNPKLPIILMSGYSEKSSLRNPDPKRTSSFSPSRSAIPSCCFRSAAACRIPNGKRLTILLALVAGFLRDFLVMHLVSPQPLSTLLAAWSTNARRMPKRRSLICRVIALSRLTRRFVGVASWTAGGQSDWPSGRTAHPACAKLGAVVARRRAGDGTQDGSDKRHAGHSTALHRRGNVGYNVEWSQKLRLPESLFGIRQRLLLLAALRKLNPQACARPSLTRCSIFRLAIPSTESAVRRWPSGSIRCAVRGLCLCSFAMKCRRAAPSPADELPDELSGCVTLSTFPAVRPMKSSASFCTCLHGTRWTWWSSSTRRCSALIGCRIFFHQRLGYSELQLIRTPLKVICAGTMHWR